MNKLAIGLLATSTLEKYRKQITACKETWGQLAEKFKIPVFFFGGNHQDKEVPVTNLPDVEDGYDSCIYKQFLGHRYMYENHPSEFYYFGGTDNYVVVERLLKYLEGFDFNEPLYIGGHGAIRDIDGEKYHYHSGGAGFVLSHGLMRSYMTKDFLLRKLVKCGKISVSRLTKISSLPLI